MILFKKIYYSLLENIEIRLVVIQTLEINLMNYVTKWMLIL